MLEILNLIIFLDRLVSNFFVALVKTYPFLYIVFEKITFLGSYDFIIYMYILLAALSLILYHLTSKRQYYYKYFLSLTVSLFVSTLTTYYLKIHFYRLGPVGRTLLESDFSFPSGHTTAAVSFFGIIYFLLNHKFKNSTSRKIFLLLTICLVFLIGLSRLVLDAHYLSDVLAGVLVGCFGLVCAMYISRKIN